MSKLLKRYQIALIISAIVPLAAFAQQDLEGTVDSFIRIASKVVTFMFVLAVVVFGYGIVKFIMASGNADEIKKAKGRITWGIIAMAVLASIFGLIQYIQNTVGVSDTSGTIVPVNIEGVP